MIRPLTILFLCSAGVLAQPAHVWNDWLLAASNRPEYQNPSGLISWWKFDEATGSTSVDSHGTNTVNVNSATWTNGYSGSGLYFSGSTYAYPYESGDYRVSNITISAYLKLPSTAGGLAICYPYYSLTWSAPYASWYLGTTPSRQIEVSMSINGTQRYFDTVATFAADTWVHAVVTFNGSNMILYTNGVVCTNYAISGSITYNPSVANAPTLGRRGVYQNGSYYIGSVDSMKIFNRALSADEAVSLYGQP